MPCHHNLEKYLTEYIEGTGIADDPKGPLFRTLGRKTKQLTRTPLPRVNAYAMIQRRAADAGIDTKIGNHSFRATGITAYLKNGGTLEKAASMANHAPPAPPSSTTAAPMKSPSMKSSGLGFEMKPAFYE
jgi:integrase